MRDPHLDHAALRPESLRAEVEAALAEARERLDAFAATPADADGEAIAIGFDRIAAPIDSIGGWIGLYTEVHPDEGVRDAAREAEQALEKFSTELSLHRGAYEVLARVGDATGDLAPDAARRLEHALRDYRRSGVDRDDATRDRITALRAELVEIGQQFDKNIVTQGRTLRVEGGHAALAGLPDDFLASHPEDADGVVTLSTDPTDRMPVMSFAESGELRRQYLLADMQVAYPDNLEVLERLIRRRHELARLLGYATWADYVTEVQMTGSAAKAREFTDGVVARVRDRAQREVDELLELKRETEPDATSVREYDRLYLIEQMRSRRFDVDARAVRPYLPYAAVRDGVLATSERLYGVTLRRAAAARLWHPDVEAYEVVRDGRAVARFYLDMHPRADKYKHAAMFHLHEGVAGGDLPAACLVCNFPRPTGDDPGLLVFDQVTTFFHEFGHLLHHLFAGGQRFLAFSGIATEWDFVEVPSQLYEEWAWDPRVLRSFAKHQQTGEPIPAELVERMRAAEEYGKGVLALRQMTLSAMALDYYTADPDAPEFDIVRTMLERKRETDVVPHEEGGYFVCRWGHLHGYSAMYYTYMWSFVIAKDLYERFEPDVLDPQVAAEYRERVLEPGGTRDASELVGAFLGRESRLDAFERWLDR